MKSVKYDIDSVALPLASGRWTFDTEMNTELESNARKSSGCSRCISGSRKASSPRPITVTAVT